MESVTIIHIFLSFRTFFFFYYYYQKKKEKSESPKSFQWAEVGMSAGWMRGRWEAGGAARSPLHRGLGEGAVGKRLEEPAVCRSDLCEHGCA